MRAIVLALGLLAAPSVAEDLRSFDFMGYVAGETISSDKLKKCTKGPEGECAVPLVKISNVYAGYLLRLHDGKLSSVFVDAHPNSYDDLYSAFIAKYGKPCEVVDTVWRNAAGAAIDNPTTFWCFRTGKLMFARYGAQIDKMAILYEDENKASNPPKINF